METPRPESFQIRSLKWILVARRKFRNPPNEAVANQNFRRIFNV